MPKDLQPVHKAAQKINKEIKVQRTLGENRLDDSVFSLKEPFQKVCS